MLNVYILNYYYLEMNRK